jgi:hypothetical protein
MQIPSASVDPNCDPTLAIHAFPKQALHGEPESSILEGSQATKNSKTP